MKELVRHSDGMRIKLTSSGSNIYGSKKMGSSEVKVVRRRRVITVGQPVCASMYYSAE